MFVGFVGVLVFFSGFVLFASFVGCVGFVARGVFPDESNHSRVGGVFGMLRNQRF